MKSSSCLDKHKSLYILLLFIVSITFNKNLVAQDTDSTTVKKDFRNSIKLNLTSGILYNNAFQMSYERVLNKKQTIGVFGGYNEFPISLNLDVSSAKLGKTTSTSGYSIGVDYRFYMAKENKYPAPHGLYLGPFMSYYHFNTDKILTDSIGSQSTTLSTNINFLNIGGELGYQFVLGKRWVIDAVLMGPAYTFYKFKASVAGNLNGVNEDEVIQKIIDALKDRLPLLDRLSSEEGISGSGVQKFWAPGFRYGISVGFRF